MTERDRRIHMLESACLTDGRTEIEIRVSGLSKVTRCAWALGGSVSLRFAPFDSNCFEVSLRFAAFNSNCFEG